MRILLFLIVGCLTNSVLFAEAPYLKVVSNEATQTECLQIAIRTFEVDARVVKLVAVSHIGTQSYYEGLQVVLNKADVVLFEGVDGDRPGFRQLSEEQIPERSSLQANLARALGLVFQLHHIDYTPEHFVNSDVSSDQLLALFKGQELPEKQERGEERLDQLMSTMDQSSPTGQLGAAVLEVLKSRPGWSRSMRWAMVNTLGSVQGNVSSYTGLPDEMRKLMEVLLERRNDIVLLDLAQQIAGRKEGESIAVFYGAAHMVDIHERLVQELGAVETGVEWRNAFCGNLQTSGLNVIQKGMVEWFVIQQVRTMELMSAPAMQSEGSAPDSPENP